MPDEQSPLRDATGSLCTVNQEGDVWFLAGARGGGKVMRSCTIPAGKAIFLPLISTVFFRGGACADRAANAAATSDHLAEAYFELDGVAFQELLKHRQKSAGCFSLSIEDHDAQIEETEAATDGYWVMLRPLTPGEHVMKFKASFNQPSEHFGQMKQDVVYLLRVVAS